jgi:hypothetical protein
VILSARQARARRAAEHWLEANACEVPLDVLARATAAKADELGRDLDVREVHALCVSSSRAWLHQEEQRRAEEARASARETERLDYVAKVRADLLLTRDEPQRKP